MRGRQLAPLILALGALITPIGFALIPGARNGSPIFQALGWIVLIWQLALALGGSFILVGWWWRRIDLVAAGYVASSAGAFVYVAAAFTVRGWAAWTGCCLIATLAGGELGGALAAIRGRT